MGACTCQPKDKSIADEFLKHTDLTEWSLLSLQDMVAAGNTLKDIEDIVPFRHTLCVRSVRCCGECTRLCRHRCVQDCLHRIYMWRQLVNNTAEEERHLIPLAIRCVVSQHFEDAEDLSLVVSEIISTRTNPRVKEYLQNENASHPYRNDYAPMYAADPATGKRVVNPSTGDILVLKWPKSGLCPYCLPRTTLDRRYLKGKKLGEV